VTSTRAPRTNTTPPARTALSIRPEVLRVAVSVTLSRSRRRDVIGNDRLVAALIELACVAAVDAPDDVVELRCIRAVELGLWVAFGGHQ